MSDDGYKTLTVDGKKVEQILDLLREITEGPQEGVAVTAVVLHELNKMRKDGEPIPPLEELLEELRVTLNSVKATVVH